MKESDHEGLCVVIVLVLVFHFYCPLLLWQITIKLVAWNNTNLIILQFLWVRNVGGLTGFSGLTGLDQGVSRAMLLSEGYGEESPCRLLQDSGRIPFCLMLSAFPFHLQASNGMWTSNGRFFSSWNLSDFLFCCQLEKLLWF